MPSTALIMSSAPMLNSAIASVPILAAVAKSAPVELASKTVDSAAPSKISAIVRPFLPSISMASAASVALTFRLGLRPNSLMRSPNGATSSAVAEKMAAMPLICASMSIAAFTPSTATAVTAADAAIAPAATTPVTVAMPALKSSAFNASVTYSRCSSISSLSLSCRPSPQIAP